MQSVHLLLVLLLAGICLGQFDHLLRTAQTLNLGTNTATTGPNSQYTRRFDSVNDVIIAANCQENLHQVTSVQTNVGPLNSGSYFLIELTNPANATLFHRFGVLGSDIDFQVAESNPSGSGRTCTPSANTCTYRYYCSNYPNAATLRVNIGTSPSLSSDSDAINSYTLRVTQYVQTITTIPASRTVSVTQSFVDPFGTDFGPADFIQYYHDLQATLTESGRASRLYVQLTGISSTSSSVICVNFNGAVATNQNAATQSYTSLPNIDDNNPIAVNGPLPGCSNLCYAAAGNVTLVLNSCTGTNGCGFPRQLWIGVRPVVGSAQGSPYTVSLRFRPISIAPVTQVTAVPSLFDGELEDQCNGQIGDFSCEDYYQVSLSNINNPAFNNRNLGPYLSVELFALHHGSASLEIRRNALGGVESGCPGCDVVATCSVVCDDPQSCITSCWRVVQPCQWSNLADNFVVTVIGENQDDNDDPIEYGLRVNVGSWPLETIVPTAWATGQPNFGEVFPDHYRFYQVTFTEIFDDSYFQVELYTNHDENRVALAWRYNEFFSQTANGCYENWDGYCETQKSCAEDFGTCRFLFVPCPKIERTFEDFFTASTGLGTTTNSRGRKVSNLQQGTYFFYVRGLEFARTGLQGGPYDTSIAYTITWNLFRSIPLYDTVTLTQFVYPLDYSPQYAIVIPDDDQIYGVRVRISEVHNGGVTAYLNCGSLAGACPCWRSVAETNIVSYDGRNIDNGERAEVANPRLIDGDLRILRCACDSDTIYVSLEGYFYRAETQNFAYDLGRKPITYTITAYFERYNEVIEPIQATRARTVITDAITDPIPLSSPFDINFLKQRTYIRHYRIDFTNVDRRRDALIVGLRADPALLRSTFGNTFTARLIVSSGSLITDRINNFPTTSGVNCRAPTTCLLDFKVDRPENTDDRSFGFCNLVFQPCIVPSFCVSNCESNRLDSRVPFDYDSEWFVSVALDAQNSDNILDYDQLLNPPSRFSYTLTTQLVEQRPYILNADQPFYGLVSPDSYVHFRYNLPGSIPANTKLVMEIYVNHDQGPRTLEFHANYFSGQGEPIFAGRSVHCYGNSFGCDICSVGTSGSDRNSCAYEVDACTLRTQTSGAYFLSVYAPNAEVPADEFLEFTVTVRLVPIAEILNGLVGIPVAGNLYSGQSLYYSVTVPNPLAQGNILGRILEIEVESVIFGEISVLITQLQPDNQCDCTPAGFRLSQGDEVHWTRYPCELRNGDVYYIAVDGSSAPDNECNNPIGFVIHAKINNVLSLPITLTTQTGRIRATYSSNLANTPAQTSFTVNHNEYTVMTFSTTAQAGDVLAVELTHAQGQGATKSVQVWLSSGDFVTRSGNNGDGTSVVGPLPNNANCISGVSCTITSGGAPCRLTVDACALPNGPTNWFLSFTGEDLPAQTRSEIIDVQIRLIASESIIVTPGLTTYATPAVTNGLTFANNVDRAFTTSYFTTNTTMGINAGDSVTFSVTGTSSQSISVRYAAETAPSGCAASCRGTSSCTIFACAQINPATWFIAIQGGSETSGATFSISRTQSPAGTSNINALPINQQQNFESLGNNEWRYHSYSVPASTAGRFNLDLGSVTNRVVFVDSPVVLPGLVLTAEEETTIFSDGSSGNTCGGFTLAAPAGECCYPQSTRTFAVVGSVGAYQLQVRQTNFEQSTQSVSAPTTISSGVALEGRVAWYSFILPANNHLWFRLEANAQSDPVRIYLNRGSRAGSNGLNGENDFSTCFPNDGLVGVSSNLCTSAITAGNSCSGFISSCRNCLGNNEGSQFFFAVLSENRGNASFSLSIIPQVFSQNIVTGTNNLVFPVSASNNPRITGNTRFSDPFATYAHYQFSFNRSPYSLPNFIPLRNDPALANNELAYPSVRFAFSNFRNLENSEVVNSGDLAIFINTDNLAGSGDPCYGGRQITSGGASYPCLENSGGAAQSNNTNVVCSIRVCDLICESTVYLSVARANQVTTNYGYSLQISEIFSDVLNFVDIRPVTIGNSGNTVFTYNQDNRNVVYLRITSPSFAQTTSWFNYIFSTGSTDSISVQFFNGYECVETGLNPAGSFSNSNTLVIRNDPCATPNNLVDANTVGYIRVSRASSTGSFNFTLTAVAFAVQPIDTVATTLTPPTLASYSATKEIRSDSWHFYEFNVVQQQAGYDTFSVSVSEIGCVSDSGVLDVYWSWSDVSNNPVIDVARPRRWPTASCRVAQSTSDASQSVRDLCTFFAGRYRVGIYARPNFQRFADPILGTTYPGIYEITATVTTVAHQDHPAECLINNLLRGEHLVEAQNRGGELIFDSIASTSSYSNNANPFPLSQNTRCNWGEVDGDFSGNDDRVFPSEIETGFWYLYNPTADQYRILPYRPTIPVADLSSSSFSRTWSASTSQNYYSYYKVVVDRSLPLGRLVATLRTTECNTNCEFDLYLANGPRGYAAAGTTYRGRICDLCAFGDGCASSDSSCSTSSTGVCNIFSDFCTVSSDEYFLGVVANRDTLCSYSLTVQTSQQAVALRPNVETCSTLNCFDYYQLTDASGSTNLANRLVRVTVETRGTVNVFFSTSSIATSGCNTFSGTCNDNRCVYEFSCISNLAFVTIGTSGTTTANCAPSCDGTDYSILLEIDTLTVQTAQLGVATTSQYVSFTASQFTVVNNGVFVPFSVGSVDATSSCTVSSCVSSPVLVPRTQPYYFNNQGSLVFSSLPNLVTLTNTFQTYTFTGSFFHFVVNPVAGSETFRIEIDDVSYYDRQATTDVDSALNWYLAVSAVAPPFRGCLACDNLVSGNFLTSNQCGTGFLSRVFSCVAPVPHYFTISTCTPQTCDVTFRMRVVSDPALPTISGNHNTEFTVLRSTAECDGTDGTFRFVATVTQENPILSVTLKEPLTSSGSVSIRGPAGAPGAACSGPSCGIQQTTEGQLSSCRIDSTSCSQLSCAAPGTYYIEASVDLVGAGSQVSLQVVNQFVDFSNSVSASIIGAHKHFYRMSNAGALSLSLTIVSGPPVLFTVFDGCRTGENSIATFQESQVCAFGSCYVWIPTNAKRSLRSSVLYIEIESGSIGSSALSELNRNFNADAEKATDYILRSVQGTANCAPPPSTGFCANTTFEGINVFTDYSSNSVWNWLEPQLRDNEAQCRFNNLIEICPSPTRECRQWLKVLSCLESFPQCDSQGYQNPICRDVCFEVERVCGADFARIVQAQLIDGFSTPNHYSQFSCCSSKYVDTTSNTTTGSSCYRIPPPPPPPPAIPPPPLGEPSSGDPPSLVLPNFPPLYAYFEFNVGKGAEIEREFIDLSAASNIVYSLSALLLVVLLLV